MCADLGVAPYDAVAPIASSRLHIKYKTARVIQDIAFMVCALLVHGSVGVATFVIAFFAGPLINYWTIRVSRPILHNIHLIAENKTKIRELGSSLKQAGVISYQTVISWYRQTLQTQLSSSRYSNHELDEQLDIAKNNLARAEKIYSSLQDEYNVLEQEKERRMAATNENNYYYVLIICEHHEITQAELNRIVYRQQSIITKAVQFLEINDWLTVSVDSNDRRRRIIKPTKKAIDNYGALKKIVDDANEYARKGLSDDEFAQLDSLITKVIRAMDD